MYWPCFAGEAQKDWLAAIRVGRQYEPPDLITKLWESAQRQLQQRAAAKLQCDGS